jgi:CRISPR/Cas system-associated endonuclease Cas1
MFPRQDARRVREHWLRFGTRHSSLTGQPRLAVNPPNAILNYCFALAESECRLAVSACGLHPGIGFLHVDKPNRDSLSLDVLEAIRPSIEAWLLNWITHEPLRRSDFFETANGQLPTDGSTLFPTFRDSAHLESRCCSICGVDRADLVEYSRQAWLKT